MTAQDRVLQVALSHLGEEEKGGANKGPIVEWSIQRWTHKEPGAWAKWCAGFVSTCVDEAQAGGPDWHRIASLSCESLWARCCAHGLAHGEDLALVQAGDLIFFGRAANDLDHVGLVEVPAVIRLEGLLQGALHTVEGNSHNRVQRVSYDMAAPARPLFGYVRLPSD